MWMPSLSEFLHMICTAFWWILAAVCAVGLPWLALNGPFAFLAFMDECRQKRRQSPAP